jgi:hypothetical protein
VLTGVAARMLADRAGWAGGHPDAVPETGPDGSAAGVTAVVVLRAVEPAALVAGARAFAAALSPAEAAQWRRSWTRTRFVFGNPANLAGPVSLRVTTPSGAAAWTGPFPVGHVPGPLRLLKPVTGTLPASRLDTAVPGRRPVRRLAVAVADRGLVDYLVHLHHTVAEAVLMGRLDPDDAVDLRHHTALDERDLDPDPVYARVLPDPAGSGNHRLHTWLV